jgi:predicted small lipoprotein YifL
MRLISLASLASPVLVLVLVLALAACGDTPPLFGPPTEAVCPPTSTLTYESFGKPFMESYCTECHDSALRGEDRQGAPSFHDFDTLFGIRAVSDHIDYTSAAGPGAVNTSMPPSGEPKPTREERELLGQWLACGAPEM